MKTKEIPGYIPGICNIGPEEIARRYRIGYLGGILCLLSVLVIELTGMDRIWRLVIVAPVGLALIGFLQARQRFCFNYGFRGVYSLACRQAGLSGRRQLTTIPNDEFIQKDRWTATVLLVKILLGSLLIAVFYYFLPGKG
jgi:hypothetical protein